jgi:hypothetical protein
MGLLTGSFGNPGISLLSENSHYRPNSNISSTDLGLRNELHFKKSIPLNKMFCSNLYY